jgi:hypothetical protein
MVRDLVEESSATLEEFDTAFPEIEPVEIETHEHPREMAMRPMKYAPHARQAKALLGQLRSPDLSQSSNTSSARDKWAKRLQGVRATKPQPSA